jgi:sodium ion-translocating decarboxylase beta subunit
VCLTGFALLFSSLLWSALATTPAEQVEADSKPEPLTFRILASRAYSQDEQIIRRAEAATGRDILDNTGKLLARWVPIAESQKASFERPNPDMVLRERDNKLEVLVKFDDGEDITSEYLTFVGRGMGQSGNPGVAFNLKEACATSIIGGADGPTSIYIASKLAPHLMATIAVAAYSYMALVPVIQPPIMKLLTTKKERLIKMKQLREVSQKEKALFPIVVFALSLLIIPSAAPLIGCLMFGNFLRECKVVDRLSDTSQNALMNIVSMFLSLGVGSQMTPEKFLNPSSLIIVFMGLIAFALATAGGVLVAKFMNLFLKDKINPLIGSAGVSAVPMAARVSNKVGLEADPGNFLLMHAMGPNVAGVIGTAIAAGVMMAIYGG